MRWLRPAFLTLLMLCAMACQPRPEGPLIQVLRSSDFHPDSLDAVAFLAFSGGMAGDAAVQVVEPILEDQLLGQGYPFVVLPRRELSRRAQAEDVGPLLGKVRDFWRGSQKVDKFKLAELCAAVGIQGVLVGQVDDWIQVKASEGTGESSVTRVAASLAYYSAANGRRAWKARAAETVASESLEQDITDARELTSRGRERLRAKTVQSAARKLPAPDFDVVARSVAAALAAALAG